MKLVFVAHLKTVIPPIIPMPFVDFLIDGEDPLEVG
jgi:hypothetical protein